MFQIARCRAKACKAGVAVASILMLGGSTGAVDATGAHAHGTLPSIPPPPPGLPPQLPAEVLKCAGCHLNPGLRLAYRDSTGHLHQDYIDADAYVASLHFRKGMRECTDCHKGDYSTFPHPASNKEPSCLDCHEQFRHEYANIDSAVHRSVHYAPDTPVRVDCVSCHSPHTMRTARDETVAEKNAACVDCHEKRYNPSGLTLVQRHAWHPQAALHLHRIACIDCHTQPSGSDYSFRHDILPKAQATSNCYTCHGADTKMAAYVGTSVGGRPHPYTRAQLVHEYYVSGATRSRALDVGGLLFMLLVMVGTGAHAYARCLHVAGDEQTWKGVRHRCWGFLRARRSDS